MFYIFKHHQVFKMEFVYLINLNPILNNPAFRLTNHPMCLNNFCKSNKFNLLIRWNLKFS